MFIDHCAYCAQSCGRIGPVLSGLLRTVGRLAFPLFVLMLVQGFRHTRDLRGYALRLGVFALLSEIPFDLMISGKVFDPARQNVMFTLLAALLMLRAQQWVTERVRPELPRRLLWIAAVGVFAAAAEAVRGDYGWAGPALAAVLSFWKTEIPRGKQDRYFFYLFYPAHMLALALFWRIL